MASRPVFTEVAHSEHVTQSLQDFLVAPELIDQPESEAHDAVRMLLSHIGEDPQRQGLLKTPDRVVSMYDELTIGYHTDPVKLINGALFDVEYDEMVLVKDIEFYSMCEHHMLPFFGHAHVAYIPNGKVIGLSKIPRIVDMFARRLQVQERMTTQIAKFLDDALQPRGVAVLVEGAHMCGMMRGVKKTEARMTTTAMLGSFKEDTQLRRDFITQVDLSRSGR